LFAVGESGGMYCTERLKRFVDARGFTNILFVEDGWIQG
jgi:hypothetical protein